jgi:tetratricopeptide (TPR) repeat protein
MEPTKNAYRLAHFRCCLVELELGLLEEAEEKYELALARASGDEMVLLAYGRAMTLLLMAKRDHQDGKSGAAYKHLLAAIDSCTLIAERDSYACVNKLLGDLYSYGREIPLDVFPRSVEDTERLSAKLSFISKGEACYRKALALSVTDEAKASLMTDTGSNMLLRAQLTEFHELKGLWGKRIDEAASLYSEAANSFRSAIDVIPDLAAAWCGLACSLVSMDPLMAQHAFVRSLQLDNKAPDTYANLSFLYTKFQRFDASTFVSDALTEVADTPSMWINRALVLEDRIGILSAKQQAADAYRAALQVSKTPEALLGLAMTLGHNVGSTESTLILEQYLGLWGCSDVPAVALHGTTQIGFATSRALHYATEVAVNGAKAIELQLSTIGAHRVEDDRGKKLQLDKFLFLAKRAQEESDLFKAKTVDTAWSLQRQVVNSPGDPTLWLRLTKSLLHSSALCDAEKTVGRAVELFETKLKDTPCAASNVADAYGLEQLIRLTSKTEVDEGCIRNLQRSLIMDPSNSKARKALSLLCA